MVTRRSTHPHHAKPSGTPKRSAQRRHYAQSRTSSASTRRGSHGSSVGKAKGSISVPTPNGELLLTRRHFLFGALGVGALAAVGAGGSALVGQQAAASGAINVLKVPTSAVTKSDSSACVLIDDASTRITRVGRFELPYGTLLWASGDDVAACLLPNDEAKPLVKVGLLSLSSGNLSIVLDQAVGQNEGFEIYDVRANSDGVIWMEANILDSIWRIYSAKSDGTSIDEPQLIDQGDANWETPSIAAVGIYAFWQVMPKSTGSSSSENSLVKRATMGENNGEVVYTSMGRLCTPPYPLADSLVITPRAETTGTYYQLTHLDAASGEVLDTMILPRSMRPLEAGYGNTGFTFSFDAIYSYGDGIANLGTYVPAVEASDGNYSGVPWFSFSRAPTAAPSWCGSYFMVKSSTTVCGVDLKTNEYFAIQPDDGAENYGEYLASTGSNSSVVTYANIDHKPVDGEPKKYCLVSIWEPLV